MAGHSKWAQIKHKKAVTDARRGKLWTKLLREVTVAARLGGGDLDGNPRLRSAVQDARAANVPNDNIDRAIRKGTGELEGASYEEVVYEGYGPAGVAILVEAMTDNRNRTVAELRRLFSKNGGNLGDSGCVAWQFDRRGYFSLPRSAMGDEALMELALALAVDDIAIGEEQYELFTSVEDYNRVREELEAREAPLESKELVMVPQSTVEVEDPEQVAQVLALVDALEDHDDTQDVWINLELDAAAVLAAQAAD
jgi:YebC/PmpR family DNA-binding regulatory protein